MFTVDNSFNNLIKKPINYLEFEKMLELLEDK